MRFFAIVLVLMCISAPARSADANGTTLLRDCGAAVRYMDDDNLKNVETVQGSAFCFGLVQGVVTTNQIYQKITPDKALFCVPPTGVNNGQAARVVAKYLRDNPKELHQPDTFLVVMALRDAFPCQGTQAER
ncbi:MULTISPECIES: Rap1a/Tai family immunity protein [unclassified Lysobacter]|uniref:Rap1a/Tai family immunity protein n=1 Tax=unclassified Lysobacter TaxID=2635362 RepID=UPI0031B57BDF